MRFRSLRKWQDPAALGPLVYFAQLLEEMLFDFSLDTYKPSATNSSLLCLEALSVIQEIEKGSIKKPNIDHVIEELSDSLKRDEVSKALISINLEKALSEIQNKTLPISNRKVTLEIIFSEINIENYKKKNEELIISAIKEAKDNKIIRSLARSYITTLKNYGFSSKWLYEVTTSFFYFGSNRIESLEAIDDYINIFQGTEQKYSIIYRASEIFKTISDSCQKLKMTVGDNLEEFTDHLIKSGFKLRNEDETYVLVGGIRSLDSYMAREQADQRMEIVSTLLTLFHHKEHPTWTKECLVICEGQENARKIRKAVNPMHKCLDHRKEKASKRLNALIAEFTLDDRSFPKFTRSAELHSLALNSDSLENQMINLWIALESLVPPKTNDEQANIESIIESCLPFLNLNYINRLLGRLLSDLVNWSKPELNKALRGIQAASLRSKLVKLMVLEENSAKMEALIANFRDFHLLRDRFFYIKSVVESPKKVQKTLDTHEQRVKWQIRRIYRARNIIVHTGNTPSFTPILIENIHDYLDLIMGTLVTLASSGRKISTVEQGFKYIYLNHSAYRDGLKNASDEIYLSDVEKYLFKYAI